MRARSIAIVGYGTAGQAAAVLLSRDGHRVTVFERVARPGPVGAGFLLQPTGLLALWSMGLLPAARAHGAPVRRLVGTTPGGRTVMDMRYADLDARLCGLGMQRGALFELLHAAWDSRGRLHPSTRIVDVEEGGRWLRDDRGHRHGPFDLAVVADGAASGLRTGVDPTGSDRPYPWGALWCLLPAGDWRWTDELRQRYRRARRMVGMLPVGTRPGDPVPRISFFWSLPVADFEPWVERGVDRWRVELASLWPEAEERLGADFEPSRLARASYRHSHPRRWVRERTLLIGDAAHAMSPQLGQGVNMALLDARSLRDALRAPGDLDTALAGHQRQRVRHVGIYRFWSRWLTPLFQSDHDWIAAARDGLFQPLGRLPGGRGHMLRVLSGTQQGLLSRIELDPAFLAAMADIAAPAPPGG